jgi:cytochrome c-type biogenesis protein CcmH/NrfG
MILRLSSPAARILLALLASIVATALSYSGIRNALTVHDAELNTPEGYERAIRLEPDNATNWYLQYSLEDPDAQRAIRAYQTALSFDSHSADTWLDLATAYESEGDIAAARNAFVQAKRMYSLSPEGFWRYGNFLLRRGELDAAFAEIKQAVEADAKRGRAAVALSRRFEPDLNAALERVLPHTRDSCFSVISVLCEQQQTDQALIVWSRLAALHPHTPISESYPLLAWTDDVRGTQPWTQVELPWTSGNDVRERHLCVSRLPSAKFPSKIGGSAWIDDVNLVPLSAENTKQ